MLFHLVLCELLLTKQSLSTTVPFDFHQRPTRTAGYSCPSQMSYSPWTKCCVCPPGQRRDRKQETCTGSALEGAWPQPSIASFGSFEASGVDAFCAKDPHSIVKFDGGHEYCQTGTHTLTFLANKSVTDEIGSQPNGVDVSKSSRDLQDVVAGLSGLYLPDMDDAVTLFNTDRFSLSTPQSSVSSLLTGDLAGTVKGLGCPLGLGSDCKHDCVGDCVKGCKNSLGLDLGGTVGSLLDGLSNGLCILPGVLKVVDGLGGTVTKAVDELLCAVGNVLGSVLDDFDCDCGKDNDGGDDGA